MLNPSPGLTRNRRVTGPGFRRNWGHVIRYGMADAKVPVGPTATAGHTLRLCKRL